MTYLNLKNRVENRTFNLEPLFWKILREASNDPEKLIMASLNRHVQDLFVDLTTRYNSLDIRNCPENKPQLFRLVTLRALPTDIASAWDSLTDYQKAFFEDNYFVTPLTDGRYCFKSELESAGTISTLPDGGGKVLSDFDDYVSGEGKTFFEVTPFSFDEIASIQKTSSIKAPWGQEYDYEEVLLYANDITLTDSPLYNNYEGLVLDEDLSSYFDEGSLYSVFVYNFYKVLYQGATLTGLQGFINALAGSPYILEDFEKVVRYEIVYIPGEGFVRKIFTNKNEYKIPLEIPIGSWVQINEVLPKFTPLGEYVVVENYTTDPDWGHGEELSKTAELTDKSTLATSDIIYDLETLYDFSDIDSAPVANRPRFDIAFSNVNYQGKLHTSSHGVWHNLVGPIYVRFSFSTEELYNNLSDIFKIILRETVPTYIMYSVRLNTGLLDYLGGVLLDHEGEPLLDSLG